MLNSEAHHAYFETFLEFHDASAPWNLYLDFKELEKISDPNERLKKLQKIMQTYFQSDGTCSFFYWFVNAEAIFQISQCSVSTALAHISFLLQC